MMDTRDHMAMTLNCCSCHIQSEGKKRLHYSMNLWALMLSDMLLGDEIPTKRVWWKIVLKEGRSYCSLDQPFRETM